MLGSFFRSTCRQFPCEVDLGGLDLVRDCRVTNFRGCLDIFDWTVDASVYNNGQQYSSITFQTERAYTSMETPGGIVV